MTMVAATDGTVILSARAEEFAVFLGFKNSRHRFEKAGPSGAAVEFHVRGKKWRMAARAFVDSLVLVRMQGTGKCAFRPFFS